jgi:RNA polymerase sigma factor (sigma-70 family)
MNHDNNQRGDGLGAAGYWKMLGDPGLAIEVRFGAFAGLLACDRGPWQRTPAAGEAPPPPQSLLSFVSRVAYHTKRTMLNSKVKFDAVDEQAAGQDTLMALFFQAPTIDDMRPWLFATIRQQIRNSLRGLGPLKWDIPDQEPPAGAAPSAAPAPPPIPEDDEPAPSPEHDEPTPANLSPYHALEAAIERLSPSKREVIKRFYFDGQPTKAIAAALSTKDYLVRKNLERGKDDLAMFLTGKPREKKKRRPRSRRPGGLSL